MGKASVLVMDDDQTAALNLVNQLESIGYSIKGMCGSGEMAVQTARDEQPDLVLIDLNPANESDAFNAAHLIRTTYNLPVIFLTDSTGRQADAATTIIKPYTEKDLEIKIEIALYKHEVDQTQREREDQSHVLAPSAGDLEKTNAYLAALANVSARIQQDPDPDSVLDAMGKELSNLNVACSVVLLEHDNLLMYYTSIPHELQAQIKQLVGLNLTGGQIPASRWPDPEAVYKGKPLFYADPEPLLRKILQGAPVELVQSLIRSGGESHRRPVAYLPMVMKTKVIGGLVVWGQGVQKDKLPALHIFANLITGIIENERLRKETQRLTVTDPLTGANNRRNFMTHASREFERWMRYHHPFSLVMLDIDNFKRVNDSFGLQAGDSVLKQTVERMLTTLRNLDFLARVGGEEFIILLPDSNEVEGIKAAERILQAINKSSFIADSNEIHLTASLGVASTKSDVATLDQLMRQAEQATYLAKSSGKNCVKGL